MITSLTEEELSTLQSSPLQSSPLQKVASGDGVPRPGPNYSSSPSPEIPDETYSEEYLEDILQGKKTAPGTTPDEPLACRDFVDLLCLVDDNVRNGIIDLDEWQLWANNMLCHTPPDGRPYTKKEKLHLSIVAANGSGKDSYVIAPYALWLCLCKRRSRCIITTGSAFQMKNQTENYIRNLAERINTYFKDQGFTENVLLVRQRHIVCTITRSEIVMFVTDDPGKAEGFHPFSDAPDGTVVMIVNEAKTVPSPIYGAFRRCTYSIFLEISSSGEAKGDFYQHVTQSVLFPASFERGKRYARVITSFDCNHKSQEEIEEDKRELGENSPLYKSKHLSQFVTLGDSVVITSDALRHCLITAKTLYGHLQVETVRRAGMDLAAGGDENTLYVFDNNLFVGRETFTITNTDTTAELMIHFLQKYGFTPETAAEYVNADDGGVGKGILDNMAGRGWQVRRVLNQSAPILKKAGLRNRGAELWFSLKRFVEESVIILPEDDVRLQHQLSSRYFRQSADLGGIVLESKKQAKANGRGSPDRADAVALAFAGVNITTYLDYIHTKKGGVVREDGSKTLTNNQSSPGARLKNGTYTTRDLAELWNQEKFSTAFPGIDERKGNLIDAGFDLRKLLTRN